MSKKTGLGAAQQDVGSTLTLRSRRRKGNTVKESDGYHHGNLRAALLSAAGEIVRDEGIEALSLRAVARRAGVSSAAPYHHFADKAALISALAREHLFALDARSAAACAAHADPREQLRAIGRAYIEFAAENPAQFRLMFRPEMGGPLDLGAPADAPVLRVLISVVEQLAPAGGATRDQLAIAAWSLVHGFAALMIDGPLFNLIADPAGRAALADAVTAQLAAVQ